MPDTPAPQPTPAHTHPTPAPRLLVDLDAATARYQAVLAAPAGSGFRAALAGSAADVPALVSEVDRLYTLLLQARRRYADLAAAARATLTAWTDGEPDPMAYLRDEPTHPPGTSAGSGWSRR